MPSVPSTSDKWIVSNPPRRAVEEDTFSLQKDLPIPELKDGELLLQSLFFSNDPAQRTWMQAGLKVERAYGPVVRKGDVMASGSLGKVIKSRSSDFKEGTLVTSWGGGWSEYAIVPASEVVRVPEIPGKAPELALGCLGMTGMTAWGGLFEVGKIHKDQVVVISGAAGATGSVAIQIAKNIVGCKRVIGIAGGPEKCAWVKKLGADECVDYKSPTFRKDLIAATPDFVDLYFDNVGGEILNLMFKRMARYSKIIACGAISGYNDPTTMNLNNYFEVTSMRITIQGFIVFDFAKKYKEFSAKLAQAVIEGKISTEDSSTIVEAPFRDVPKVWHTLYTGGNQGKLLTKIVPAKL